MSCFFAINLLRNVSPWIGRFQNLMSRFALWTECFHIRNLFVYRSWTGYKVAATFPMVVCVRKARP